MTIEWYPGHMTKARREIAEALAGVDVVIEVVDARLPASSSNPILQKLRGNKPCVKVLNKQDLADPGVTRAWVRHFAGQKGVVAVPVEAKNRKRDRGDSAPVPVAGAAQGPAGTQPAGDGRRHPQCR